MERTLFLSVIFNLLFANSTINLCKNKGAHQEIASFMMCSKVLIEIKNGTVI